MKDNSCSSRIQSHWEGRLEDLEIFRGDREGNEDIGPFYEYGLCFDYVAPYTFGKSQDQGYWRYQLSWGGPSDEIRFFGDLIGDYRAHLAYAEYWFMDWFDGAHMTVTRDVRWIFDEFVEIGSAAHVYNEAMKDYVPPEEEPDLHDYTVTLIEDPSQAEDEIEFECQAEDEDHAQEQAENAYPGCKIINVD